MQYLLLCCFDEEQWANLPQSQQDEIMREYGAWKQDITKRGHYRAGAKLQPTASATTVRARNGKPALTDGPFAETKEQLGGYHLIECQDLDEALSIARRIPTLTAGGVIEVRPLDPTM
ncbi:MAG: YciI family protein [Sulfuricaulis sp.]